jgi:hypothetical protein
VKGDIHKCDRCGVLLIEEDDWSEDDARAEAEKLFGPLDKLEERSTLCEDCYVAFKKWWFSTHN